MQCCQHICFMIHNIHHEHHYTSVLILLCKKSMCLTVSDVLVNAITQGYPMGRHKLWMVNRPDTVNSDIWQFLLSESPSSFSPLCQNPYIPLPQGWDLFILNIRTAPWSEHHCHNPLGMWVGCWKAIRFPWVTHWQGGGLGINTNLWIIIIIMDFI